MGDRFENQQVTAYQRIVKDYPLSIHVEDAEAQLEAMKRPVPEADPVAYGAHEVRDGKPHQAGHDEQLLGHRSVRVRI